MDENNAVQAHEWWLNFISTPEGRKALDELSRASIVDVTEFVKEALKKAGYGQADQANKA